MPQVNNQLVRVMLVEDDEEDYILTRYLFDEFKDNHYEVDWVNSYSAAKAAIREGFHDIYLIDYRLGLGSGLTLIRESLAEGCRAPMILFTGQGDKEVDLEAMKAGAADYLVKGEFEAPLLERSIRYSLQHARALERLHLQATHDSLTGLPNRVHFFNLLAEAIETALTSNEFDFAVLFLDLDRFKTINDSLGHVIGDKLLVALAERLKACIRPGDVVSRFGGDEFTILVRKYASMEDPVEIAERLQKTLAVPFIIDEHEVFTSASVGITLANRRQNRPEDFLREADTAMYEAKAAGRSRYEIFDREMHVRTVDRLQIENDLRKAIEREEFRVFYQPIVDLETGKISDFEALIRWEHPQHGLIPPSNFIPVAEETGLIVPIGNWVLEESCRQVSEWKKDFSAVDSVTVSVNISTKQLMHPIFSRTVHDILGRYDMDPHCLKLEVTETAVMGNPELALRILSELCGFGVYISSDDFGTGYSSLSYLHRFPFERLKIDRSFIGKMDTDEKSEEIVRSIITLGQNLHMNVVAEGVETASQLKLLRAFGCHAAQGYLFSKPVPASHAEKMLLNGLNCIQPFTGQKAVMRCDDTKVVQTGMVAA
jgi:diguanylate cyclase (GGDEF)-like protein